MCGEETLPLSFGATSVTQGMENAGDQKAVNLHGSLELFFFFPLHIHRSREDTYVFSGRAKGIFMTWEPTVDCDG